MVITKACAMTFGLGGQLKLLFIRNALFSLFILLDFCTKLSYAPLYKVIKVKVSWLLCGIYILYLLNSQNKHIYPARMCAAVIKYSVGVSLYIYIYIYTVFPRFSCGLFYSSYLLVARYSRVRVK